MRLTNVSAFPWLIDVVGSRTGPDARRPARNPPIGRHGRKADRCHGDARLAGPSHLNEGAARLSQDLGARSYGHGAGPRPLAACCRRPARIVRSSGEASRQRCGSDATLSRRHPGFRFLRTGMTRESVQAAGSLEQVLSRDTRPGGPCGAGPPSDFCAPNSSCPLTKGTSSSSRVGRAHGPRPETRSRRPGTATPSARMSCCLPQA